MNILSKPNSMICKVLGRQPIKDSTYRFFTYLFKIDVAEGLLLYNVMTGSLLLLSKDESIVLDDINSNIESDIIVELISNWFLVPESCNDIGLNNQVHTLMRTLTDAVKHPPITNYTIFTTTDCNARCFYCYEMARKRIPMSKKTAQDVADYIYRASKGKDIIIRWFGGEPLYNSEAMDIICDRLKEYNIKFISSIVTNGYLFNNDNIDKAKNKWNISRVQITLDGTENIYNQVKAFIYKNSESSFKIVTDNIENLLKNNISVNVRLNIDDHNLDDIFQLVDYLAKRYSRYDNFAVFARLLFEDTSSKQLSRTASERHMIMQRFFEVEDYIEKKNIALKQTMNGMVRFKQCMMDNNAATTILPDGNLGKCEHFSEDNFWGSIYTDEIDEDIISKLKEIQPRDGKCDICPIKPSCILLKYCPDVPKRCDEFDKMMQIRNIKKILLNEYNRFLNQKENYNET